MIKMRNMSFFKIGLTLILLGFDPRKFVASIIFLPKYITNYFVLMRQRKKANCRHKIRFLPALSDAYMDSGVAKGHYFHQDLWASRRINQIKPKYHIDIGSRVDGFIAHVLSFMDVTVIDVRKLSSGVKGLRFIKLDIVGDDEECKNITTDSLSCLHALEHFGLGRYGDKIDFDGWLKAIKRMAGMVVEKGHFFLSVPIGEERVEYNAHRVFDPKKICDQVIGCGFELLNFSYVDDFGDFHENVLVDDVPYLSYGCGCYEFVKLK